jgi:hypothetical protein
VSQQYGPTATAIAKLTALTITVAAANTPRINLCQKESARHSSSAILAMRWIFGAVTGGRNTLDNPVTTIPITALIIHAQMELSKCSAESANPTSTISAHEKKKAAIMKLAGVRNMNAKRHAVAPMITSSSKPRRIAIIL